MTRLPTSTNQPTLPFWWGKKKKKSQITNQKLVKLYIFSQSVIWSLTILKWPVRLLGLKKTAVHWHQHLRSGVTSGSWYALQALMGEMPRCHHSCRVTGTDICSLAYLSCQTSSFPCTPEGIYILRQKEATYAIHS